MEMEKLTVQFHSFCVSLLAWMTAGKKFPLFVTFVDGVFSSLMMTIFARNFTITRNLLVSCAPTVGSNGELKLKENLEKCLFSLFSNPNIFMLLFISLDFQLCTAQNGTEKTTHHYLNQLFIHMIKVSPFSTQTFREKSGRLFCH